MAQYKAREDKHAIFAIFFILFPIAIIIFSIYSFSISTEMKISNENIVLSVPQNSTRTIDYNLIDSFNVYDDYDIGKKEKGVNDETYHAGYYRNDKGAYFAFIHKNVNRYIEFEYQGETYVINDSSLQKTDELVEKMLQK